MITVQGKDFKDVQELVTELVLKHPNIVWRNTYAAALHELDAANTVLTDYDELMTRLNAFSDAAPANEVYEVTFEVLNLFTKAATPFERSAAKGFKAKAQALSALEPRRIVLRNLADELEAANKVDGQVLHFGGLRRDNVQHVAVLNKINNVTVRIMQIAVFNWDDDATGGTNLMAALGEVGFVHVLYQWVTGQINCNMQAGSKLRNACDKVSCTMKG